MGGIWWHKRELPKPGLYNKPEWLRYLQGRQLPSPVEEEETKMYYVIMHFLKISAV
jgi:hypothetical protein